MLLLLFLLSLILVDAVVDVVVVDVVVVVVVVVVEAGSKVNLYTIGLGFFGFGKDHLTKNQWWNHGPSQPRSCISLRNAFINGKYSVGSQKGKVKHDVRIWGTHPTNATSREEILIRRNYVATNPLRRPYVFGVGGVRGGVPLDSHENMPFVVWVGETPHMYTWGIGNESWGKVVDVDVLKQWRGEELWKVGWNHIMWFCFMHGQCRERSKMIKMMFFKSPNPT